ncbi:MAG: hypothetical protein JOZ58_02020 [Acetobacteraceae bacterium]|nr:hypothetical protein [Acetobacteraceae bacterium]
MSDTSKPGDPGPQMSDAVQEVQGVFPSDSALQDAISRLGTAGFDRADISVLDATADQSQATPEEGAQNPNTEEDERQARTLHTSLAASVGVMAGAGAVVASGGALAPAVAAAAAGGLGLGGAMQGVASAAKESEHQTREEAAAKGELVLSVRLKSADLREAAEEAMRSAGATRVQGVVRAGISSASWTG